MGIKIYKNSKNEEIGYTAQYKSKKMLKSKSKTFTGQGAKSRAREWLKEVKRGDRNGTLNDLTLQEAMLEKKRQIENRGVFHSVKITQNGYQNWLKVEQLLQVKMDDCSGAYLSSLLKNLKGLFPQRQHLFCEMKLLRSTLHFYRETYNPRFIVEWTKAHTAYGKGVRKPVQAFEYSVIIERLNRVVDEIVRDAGKIEFMYGGRYGAVYAVRIEDIDYERSLVHFTGTILWRKRERQEHPKTKVQTFALCPEAREIFEKYTQGRKCGLVFSRDGLPMCDKTIWKQLNRVGLKSHDLRKSAATLVSALKNVENASELLGHASSKITSRYYIDQILAGQLSKTPAMLGKLLNDNNAGNEKGV